MGQIVLSKKSIVYSEITLKLAFRSVQIHELTSWTRVLSEKRTGSYIVKKFPEFYGT
jgi:hypothetical protein